MPHRARRVRFDSCVSFAVLTLGLWLVLAWPAHARAGAGSGSAAIAPSDAVVAGTSGTWVFTYTAADSFDPGTGGIVWINIPPGWTPPQTTDASQPGYVQVLDGAALNAITVSGGRIALTLGAAPQTPFAPGDSVRVVYGAGGGSAAASAQTMAPAQATFWISSDPSGSGPAPIASSPIVPVVAGPPDHMVVAPDTLRLVAGVPDTVAVRLFDALGNHALVTGGETLTLWTDRPQGRFTSFGGTTIFAVTIPAGRDSIRVRYTDTQAGGAGSSIKVIDANGTGPSLGTATSPVTTTPNVAFGAVTLNAVPATLVADGSDSSLVTSGVIHDQYGNAVGTGARFLATGGLVAPITDDDPAAPGAQWITDASGKLTGSIRAGTAKGTGSITVVAEAPGSATGASTLQLVASVPSGGIALAAPPDSVAADSLATLAVAASGIQDANGNVVEDGEEFTVATTLGSILTPDQDGGVAGVQVKASAGSIAFTLFGGGTAGTASVTATAVRSAASGSLPVRIVPGVVSGSHSGVVATSPASVGPVGSTITVTLRDRVDHPLPAVPSDSILVQLSGVATAAVSPLGTVTDASGAIAFRATATATGTGSVSVTARGVPLSATPSIVFAPGPLDHYVVSGPSGPLTAGVADSFQVAARDAYGNAIPSLSGVTLSISVLSGGASVPDSVFLASGASEVRFTPILASPLSVQAHDAASHTAVYGPVNVAAGPPYRVAASVPPSFSLAAGDSVDVRGRLLDAWSNPIAGGRVDASVVVGGGSVTPSSVLTDGAGFAQFSLRAGASPGPVTVRLLAFGSAAPESIRADSITVTVTPSVTASLRVLPDSLGWIAGAPVRVLVEPLDAFGNVVIADTATVTMGGSGAIAWSPPFGRLSGGAFLTFGTDTVAETATIHATRVGGGVGSAGPVTVAAATPAAIAIASGNAQTAVVARALSAPLRVTVRDRFGNLAIGAGVVFTVTSGGGSLDAVQGGAPDSVAVAGPGGVAMCDVTTLGTVSGIGNNAVRARLSAAPATQVTFTASALPDTMAQLSLAPPSLSLVASGTANVTATGRDRFGNLTPGTAVTFFLGAPAAGTLESLGGATSGGPGSQSGATDAAGTIAVRYRAPATAPAADSVFARGASVAPVGIRAVVASSSTVSLQVTPDSLGWIAGSPVHVHIRAVDAFGNTVLSDNAAVTMSSNGSVSWTPASGSLVSGQFLTTATDTVAQTVSLTASRTGGESGSAGPVIVRPADPAGAIAIAATRDTLTADGRSTADVTLGPVRDPYGNLVVAGSLVTVVSGSATLLASDASPLPGLDLATDVNGRASLVLIAPAVVGPDTLRATSRAGSAVGSHAFHYEAPPSLAYVAGTLAPSVVAPGGSYAFQVQAQNAGTGTLLLVAGTTLSFGAGPSAFAAALGSSVSIPQGQTRTLAFASTTVSPSLVPGTYAPALRAIGSDGTGEPFDFYPSLAGAQVQVAGVSVLAVAAVPDTVPLGYANLTLSFDVTNATATPATLDAAALATSVGAFTTNSITPTLPAVLAAGGTTRLTVLAGVPSTGIPAGSVDARLTVTATFAGVSVNGVNAAPLTFQVVSAARIAAVNGGATPPRYLRGRTFGPTVRVANTGTSTVNLARAGTKLVLQHPGGDLLTTSLSAASVVAGGDMAMLAFDSLAVPATVARGHYSAHLVLGGTESGQAFADTIPLDPDSVSVVDPPLLAVVGTASPDTVSAGQTRSVQVTLANSGDVAFDLDASTALSFGAPVTTTLALSAPASVSAGASLTLTFSAAPLGLATNPGTAPATLDARGLEDGRAREEAVSAGGFTAMPPAAVQIVAGSTTPDTVRAGQTYDLAVSVRNGGGSPIAIDPAASRFTLSDGVEQVVAPGSGAPVVIAPGGSANLAFPATAFPAALASQAYPVTLVLSTSEWGLAANRTVVSPPSEILVREPADAIQVRAFDAGAPVQVAPGASNVRAWGLELTPLVPNGGVTSAHLAAVRLTILTDGGASLPPGTTVASVALRDAAGTVLAQATPGGTNPVTLPLTNPAALAAAPESLWVEIGIAPATSVRDVALRLAASADLIVLDDLTGTPVPIRAGGGLPFAPLTSPALTLFAKAHGYPNPFHAGRETVRLSYVLAQDASVHVGIYTLFGDLVRELSLSAGGTGGTRGLNEVAWDGRNGKGDLVSAGVYVARIEGSGTKEQIKVGVLR